MKRNHNQHETTRFFDQILNIRVSVEIGAKIEELLRKKGHKYDSISHLVRCAIIKLHESEVKNEN